MEQLGSCFFIDGILVIVIFIGRIRRKAEWVINFILRMFMVTICIYFLNSALTRYSVEFCLAINPFSVLTSGFLGIPGIAALYGIKFYKFL